MAENNPELHAVIYNRVSSAKQESDGSGLISQEQRCIKYAEAKGYIIDKERIFHDTFSGGGDFMKRPAMRELLSYIDSNPGKNYVVIFDDLKRFARDTKFHIELRSEFNVRKVKVECLNFSFEDTPEGTFVETILAAQNQLEREQNRRQVIQKQKAHLEAGHWAFSSPIGYKMQKRPGFITKVPMQNEKAVFVKEALEGYANLRFTTLIEMINFLKEKNVFGSAVPGKYMLSTKRLIRNSFYAGYVEYEPWGVSKRKGNHVALISDETYYKSLERLNERISMATIRKDVSPEFELRGLINCLHCNHPMTGAFCKGRKKKYPYYNCHKKDCIVYKKSIKRDFVHSDFISAINDLEPTEDVINVFKDIFEECWQEELVNLNKGKSETETNRRKLETEIEKYIELAGSAQSEILKVRYEEKIIKLSKEIEILSNPSALLIDASIPYRTALDLVMTVAKNPYESWEKASLRTKKKLFYFFFDRNILYDVKSNVRTAKPSILYRVLGDLQKNSIHVRRSGNLSNQFPELLQFITKWSNVIPGEKPTEKACI